MGKAGKDGWMKASGGWILTFSWGPLQPCSDKRAVQRARAWAE